MRASFQQETETFSRLRLIQGPARLNAYNLALVITFFLSRLGQTMRAIAALAFGLVLPLTLATNACGQAASVDMGPASSGLGSGAGHGRILLVLPFDNRSGQ